LRLEVGGTSRHLRSAESQAVGGEYVVVCIALSEAVEALVIDPLVGLVAGDALEVQHVESGITAEIVSRVSHTLH